MLFRFALTCLLLTTTTFAAVLKDFSDHQTIPTWATTSFDAMLKANIISGNAQKQLKPNSTINRAEFLKILLEATDQAIITPSQPRFSDVNPEHWFYGYVETAAALNWVDGYPNGTFKPGNTINRAEIAKLINKAFGVTVQTSGNDKNWYDGHVRSLTDNNLLPYNVGQSAFNPSRAPSRAEAFEQMYRALQFKYRGNQAAPDNPTHVTTTDGSHFDYDVAANFSLTMAVTPTAGRLDLKRSDTQAKSVTVNPGQKGVLVSQIEMVARGGDVQLSDLQFRRIGNGSVNNYDALWMEQSGQIISTKQTPGNDLISMSFSKDITLQKDRVTVLNLKADLASNAVLGSSERFVLYLPDWINANTNQKIGLFPLGGSNVEIR